MIRVTTMMSKKRVRTRDMDGSKLGLASMVKQILRQFRQGAKGEV